MIRVFGHYGVIHRVSNIMYNSKLLYIIFILGEFNICSFSLIPGYGMNWIKAAFETTSESINIEHGMDPKDTYCSNIFHPGKFQRNVIAKALVVCIQK